MAIIVNTNVTSIKLVNQLNKASSAYSEATKRLSTGLQINSAADGAGNFSIAKGLEKQISGSLIASNNVDSGINLLQTAEGVLDIVQDNLLRIRDLTLEAMNGSYSTNEWKALETEAKARAVEIDRLANNAKFNDFQIFDTNKQYSDYLLVQVGTEAEELTNTIKVSGVLYGATLSSLNTSLNSATFAFSADRSTMETLLNNVNSAIDNVTERNTKAGASVNRLESAQSTLDIMYENLTAAHSNIVDTDVAKESAQYTKQYIMQQTATSLLAQANQVPSLALSLI